MRRFKYLAHQVDRCLFSKRGPFSLRGRRFLRRQGPILYFGVALIRRGASAGVAQDGFGDHSELVSAKDVLGPQAAYKTERQIRSAVKAFVGGAIWMSQR